MTQKPPLPSGTVTLLFTDIEGSTQHWEQQGAAMADALRRHDELVRKAIETHGGRVFKTMGDQFCAAFSRAPDAIASAIDAQRALSTQDWSTIGGLAARMALHSGATDERDGDYFGPPVNRVARLLAVAHGGQVVVSGLTAQLLSGAMPKQTELRDLGEHRLKDLIEPDHVWQLVVPGLPDTFPPLQSLGSLPNNLPRQVTPLVGRDDALAEIESLVQAHPLVTLAGTGGVGKTRLALHAGADLLDGSTDGVWFVELAPVSDPSLVVLTIASTLGLREQPNRSMMEVLVQYLRPRRLLLIVDNCEHLIEQVARVTDEVLKAAPSVRILATSREPVRIPAEHVYRVPSLAVPPNDSLTSAEAEHYGAIELFTDRATAADANFTLSDDNAPIVVEICRRLDGIALAIELAAARVNILPPQQLARKLDERFRVLTGGSRTALPRQQTMRALIEWSYDLLSEQERRLLRRLAIFTGGWTLEAAEIVCTDDALDALDVTDLLASLVDKSLAVAEATDDPPFHLLESMRVFALEKLEQSGERETLARRHAQWAADLGDRAYDAWWTASNARWRAEFEPELDNARSAIDWALSHGEVTLAARIAIGFSASHERLRGEAEVKPWLEAVIGRLDAAAQPALAARAWIELSFATYASRKIEAARRAFDLGNACNDRAIVALSQRQVAFGLLQSGRADEAQPSIDRALAIANESGLTGSLIHADMLCIEGMISHYLGRLDEARERYTQADESARAVGDDYVTLYIRNGLAELEFQAGNFARALELASEIEAEARASHTKANLQLVLANGAAYRIALGDTAGARVTAREALRLGRGAYAQAAFIAIQNLAAVAALTGDPRRAARLRGYVDAEYTRSGGRREPTEQRLYDILMSSLREKLGETEIDELAAEGALLSEDAGVAEALRV